jgi:hypothetical protein
MMLLSMIPESDRCLSELIVAAYPERPTEVDAELGDTDGIEED